MSLNLKPCESVDEFLDIYGLWEIQDQFAFHRFLPALDVVYTRYFNTLILLRLLLHIHRHICICVSVLYALYAAYKSVCHVSCVSPCVMSHVCHVSCVPCLMRVCLCCMLCMLWCCECVPCKNMSRVVALVRSCGGGALRMVLLFCAELTTLKWFYA